MAPSSVYDVQIQYSLPIPSTFDFVPRIQALLSRLLLVSTDKDAIQPKDLAMEVGQIKQEVQRARTAIEQIPYLDRTTADQELEIQDLKAKVFKQKHQLQSIAKQVREQT